MIDNLIQIQILFNQKAIEVLYQNESNSMDPAIFNNASCLARMKVAKTNATLHR